MSFIAFCRIGPIPELGHLANYEITCKNKGFNSRPAHAGADPAHSAQRHPQGARARQIPERMACACHAMGKCGQSAAGAFFLIGVLDVNLRPRASGRAPCRLSNNRKPRGR